MVGKSVVKAGWCQTFQTRYTRRRVWSGLDDADEEEVGDHDIRDDDVDDDVHQNDFNGFFLQVQVRS